MEAILSRGDELVFFITQGLEVDQGPWKLTGAVPSWKVLNEGQMDLWKLEKL